MAEFNQLCSSALAEKCLHWKMISQINELTSTSSAFILSIYSKAYESLESELERTTQTNSVHDGEDEFQPFYLCIWVREEEGPINGNVLKKIKINKGIKIKRAESL